MTNYFVTIAGNIGAGKSSLTSMLSRELGWQAILEQAEDNPYLENFQANPQRWAFHSQMFFLMCRLRSYKRLLTGEQTIVQDRSIYEDGDIFAQNLYQKNYINAQDWFLYRSFYDELIHLLPSPDLVVYLRTSVPVLMSRILRRDRYQERKIDQNYLAELNIFYEKWVEDFKVCSILVIETDDLDFVNCCEDFEYIKKKILSSLEKI